MIDVILSGQNLLGLLHLYDKLCIAIVVFYVIDLSLPCQTLRACMKSSYSCFLLVDFGTYLLSALVCLLCVAHTLLHTSHIQQSNVEKKTLARLCSLYVYLLHTCFFFTVNEVY